MNKRHSLATWICPNSFINSSTLFKYIRLLLYHVNFFCMCNGIY